MIPPEEAKTQTLKSGTLVQHSENVWKRFAGVFAKRDPNVSVLSWISGGLRGECGVKQLHFQARNICYEFCILVEGLVAVDIRWVARIRTGVLIKAYYNATVCNFLKDDVDRVLGALTAEHHHGGLGSNRCRFSRLPSRADKTLWG